MNRTIADTSRPLPRAAQRNGRALEVVTAGGLAVAFFLLCLFSRPAWQIMYDHFVWQADGFLRGRTTIDFPVKVTVTRTVERDDAVVDETSSTYDNTFFNDVSPVTDADGNQTGQAQIPFPPLPAVLLLPFVAAWGVATDQGLVSILLGAIDVALAFWMLGRLPIRRGVRILATLFLAGGSALWYATSIGSTWFFAHVVAVGLSLVAIALALDADAAATARPPDARRPTVEWRQIAAGFCLGLAATSRLTVAFGAVFFLFVGGGGTWFRRGLWAAIGAVVPVGALLVYNQVTTGSPFNPVYQTLYEYEVWAYPFLNYNGAWAISDPRYIPQNLGIMLTGTPSVMPACDPGVARTLVNTQSCSWVVPRPVGMSFLLASPAYLLVVAVARTIRDPRVAGALVAAGLIALVNLMHFSQGWVQFGYRFSLDFAPFLLLAVALGAERIVGWRGGWRGGWAIVGGLVAASIAIQAWGIAWARTLGW